MTYAREPMKAVKLRLQKFQEDVNCECQACLVYEVDEPPVLVPDGTGPDEFGVEVPYGRWLHGRELLQHLKTVREMHARAEQWASLALPRSA